MDLKASNRFYAGEQRRYNHVSAVCACDMSFGIYLPDGDGPFPTLFWLSGLTCTQENFVTKAGAQRLASDLGMIIVAPDTSPRGEGVPDDPAGAYDFGLGAGFYVNATQSPWSTHYQMREYIEVELYNLICSAFPVDRAKVGIFGHSMGGHGALTMGLRNPEKFKSVSAFSPICSPINCAWGEKALSGYLGDDRALWRGYDACALIEDGASTSAIFVDQGTADPFLADQLKPSLLEAAAKQAQHPLTMRYHEGYDHSYFFIATFIDDHLEWHRRCLS